MCDLNALYNNDMKKVAALTKRYPFYRELTILGNPRDKAEEILCSAIEKVQKVFVPPVLPFDWTCAVQYQFEDIPFGGLTSRGSVRLNPRNLTEWTVVHELAHAWDAANDWLISELMRKATRSGFPSRWLHATFPKLRLFWYHVGRPPAPCGVDKKFNAREDFAEALTAYIFPEEACRRAAARGYPYERYGYTHFYQTPRGKFIREILTNG